MERLPLFNSPKTVDWIHFSERILSISRPASRVSLAILVAYLRLLV